ncbi:MAG: acetoacetate--CoA ligase [Proteobacteria bacterium]|nr:acetoacetate--CoA ligase [Pseudomonadota bacterium]
MTTTESMLWAPDEQRIESAEISAFIRFANEKHALKLSSYDHLYQWSISEKQAFWSSYWDFSGIVGKKGEKILVDGEDIEKATWFPDALLNYAENLLQNRSDDTAIHFKVENKRESSLSYKELHTQVSVVAAWLRSQGVVKGDRVAAYMANMPETLVAMLAATSLGAIWTSTSPDFGAQSVIERFGQTRPKVLFTQDGYFYNRKTVDIRQKVADISNAIDSLEAIVNVSFIGLGAAQGLIDWSDLLSAGTDEELEFAACRFNDPLFILYSSGTTGQPKCITHKVGGTLLQHRKEHQLHCDIKPGDKLFYFTTCGWMMWNWLATALASRATLVLYDGSPFYPNGNVLWDYVDEVGITQFGTSAKYIDALKKHGYSPKETHDLSSIRTLCSTGSVLAPESFDFVYDSIKQDVCLSSISGGTDIMSCFVLGCPILPVYRGQSQCRGLGMAVEVYDSEGKSLTEEKGELVCTQTFPSQPAYFWGDESGQKYHDAYFAEYENIWHHGDYVSLTPEGGVIIYGRSDATLNPGGVRIGTAEIYRHVEQLDEVIEGIVVGQDWEDDVRVVLFVVLQEGLQLDEALKKKIKQTVRTQCTPRHVPAKVIQVAEIPRTKSGKIVELAVREVIHGRAVKNVHALANPEALALYKDLPGLS